MKTIIIGAGASGLSCAITLAKRGGDVLVLEKLSLSAKKILVTGNGRCNYWNDNFNNENFYSGNKMFIEEVNTLENRKGVLTFFDNLGIVPNIKNGYYYPYSMQASSIRDSLLFECKRLGIKIINDFDVVNVLKSDNKFIVKSIDKYYEADSLIIATGSYAYYKDKTSGYNLCRKFGHKINAVLPSLVQLVGKDDFYKDWQGVRSNVKVSIYVNGDLKKEETGEIMLTDYGISGICVFNLSGIANRALYNNDKVSVKIDFLPEIDDLKSFFDNRNNIISKRRMIDFFQGLINDKLVKIILLRSNISYDKYYDDLNDLEKDRLSEVIKKFYVEIIESKSYDNAQVCTGGVNVDEVNPNTMESKLCSNLYIIGEVLDVDGVCGGFNLGFAWLSGIIAGRSVKVD